MPAKFQKRDAERKGSKKEYELDMKLIRENAKDLIQVRGGEATE